jgi:hypothetical protein
MFSQKHKRATNSVCETEVDDRKEGKEKVKTYLKSGFNVKEGW